MNLALFALTLIAMALAGGHAYNGEQLAHQEPTVDLLGYLITRQFIEATFENSEWEFLQMGSYVILAAYLFQGGRRTRTAHGDERLRALTTRALRAARYDTAALQAKDRWHHFVSDPGEPVGPPS